jgi:DNA sulfur modification protein DndD
LNVSSRKNLYKFRTSEGVELHELHGEGKVIRNEYLRFMQTLVSVRVPPGVRKVANLVLDHFEQIQPLGTHKGQRIKELVRLAQQHWSTLADDIAEVQAESTQQAPSISRLASLNVGPFRGFSKAENFDLNSQVVLIYGPNGTGKSSFCEALEYGLLGTVAEAESKRFRDQREYFKNAYVNQFSSPTITAVDDQGNEIPVEPNEALYRFFFVEKNRIDSFSRIAAQAPAKQTELISTLFGLDSFNEFVRSFTTEVDERYIDLCGVKASLLAQESQRLNGAQQQIDINARELQELNNEENRLAFQYREGANFGQMVLELNGDDKAPGSIHRLEIELQQPIASKSNLTGSALENLANSIAVSIVSLTTKQQELGAASQQVSFKQLYEAVSQVQKSSPEQCPACNTPINQVIVNPYAHANEELKKLEHLAVLQQDLQQHERNVQQLLFNLSQILNTCLRHYPQNNPLRAYLVADNTQPNVGWWNSLLQLLPDGLTPWKHLALQVKNLQEADNALEQAAQVRATKQENLNRLREFGRQITILQTRRQGTNKAIVDSQQLIANFEADNARLISDVEAEKAVVISNKEIKASYEEFVRKLNAFSNNLPRQLVADLGGLVVALYNAFNRYDANEEKIFSVKLPLAQNERLLVSFNSDPAKYFDALHVLSEGHIRCIGLAILLAKNIKEQCQVLIFDDPVNAIDDEHRRAIRETLFVDDYFANTQIVLAVHGEEFFNNAHQILGKQRAASSESYIFTPAAGDKHINVNSLLRPKNYVLAARELYSRCEYKDAMMSARRALEDLCEKAWFYYGKHSDKNDALISVSRRSPSQPWDLRALTENLTLKISRSRAEMPNKDVIVEALRTLLGREGNNNYWIYLNKGTHHETDLPELDPNSVDEVVSALETLDSAFSP